MLPDHINTSLVTPPALGRGPQHQSDVAPPAELTNDPSPVTSDATFALSASAESVPEANTWETANDQRARVAPSVMEPPRMQNIRNAFAGLPAVSEQRESLVAALEKARKERQPSDVRERLKADIAELDRRIVTAFERKPDWIELVEFYSDFEIDPQTQHYVSLLDSASKTQDPAEKNRLRMAAAETRTADLVHPLHLDLPNEGYIDTFEQHKYPGRRDPKTKLEQQMDYWQSAAEFKLLLVILGLKTQG